MSGGNPYSTLSSGTLSWMDAIIEPAEDIRLAIYSVIQNPWQVLTRDVNAPVKISSAYPATVSNIGYGSTLTDVNSLGAVLQTFQLSSQVNINGTLTSFSGNVFQIAQAIALAQGNSSVPTTQSIINTFVSIISQDNDYYTGLGMSASQVAGMVNADVTSALGYYVMGQIPPVELAGTPIPPLPNAPANQILTLTQPQSVWVVNTFITGLTTPESSAAIGGTLVIQGKSPTAAASITKAYNASAANLHVATIASGTVIPGLSPDSLQWVAITDAAYLGWGKGGSASISKIGAAMAADDPAEAWYLLRYVVGSPSSSLPGVYTRDFENAAIFGLNGANTDSFAQALADYAVLTENRTTILQDEDLVFSSGTSKGKQVGVDPDGNSPEIVGNSNLLAPANAFVSIGPYAPANTLAATFDPEATQIIQQLSQDFSTVLPTTLQLDTSGGADNSAAQFSIRSTDIFVAPSEDDFAAGFATMPKSGPYTINVGKGEPGPNGAAEEARNHIVIGMYGSESLVGGLGNDILYAAIGNETLRAGLGSDTLIGGAGNDVFYGAQSSNGAQGDDVFDIALSQNPNPATATETIIDLTGDGMVDLNGQELGLGLLQTGSDQWKDADGDLYTFVPQSQNASGTSANGATSNSVGDLEITPASLSGSSSDTIDIGGFNLSDAMYAAGGFLGVQMPGVLNLTVGSNAGFDPPAPDFVAGSSQSYTVWLDAPLDTAQTVTLTLSGVSASDFGLQTDTGVTPLSSNGTFTVIIPAGQTSASFALVNTGDVGGNASMQLSASFADTEDSGHVISTTNSISQNYVEPTDDPFGQAANVGLYTDLGDSSSGGTGYEVYSYAPSTLAGASEDNVGAGSGNNFIDISNAINQSFSGGAGNDTINATFGVETATGDVDGGTDVISGDGGSDIISLPAWYSNWNTGQNDTPPSAAVSVFANTPVSLATAIANANSAVATGARGDLIDAEIAATVVGGNGNDLIFASSTDVVVAGPGNDTIVGGFSGGTSTGLPDPVGEEGNDMPGTTWSASYVNGELDYGGDLNASGVLNSTPPAGYEGNVDGADEIAESNNTTIYGGRGNDLILLSNGDNDVQLGTGNSTVFGGMGSNTIVGGNGNNSLIGGGGGDYITAGDGNSWLAGHGGDNTLIGGAGQDTLIAGNDGSNWASAETGDNYVQAGSGNTLIYGSGGNDTLIGGAGNDTILAGAGSESIVGGSGNDLIYGGAGNDTIDVGGDGVDTVWAGSGNTTLYGGDGADALHGGSGTNVIYVGDGGTDSEPTYAAAGSGATTLYGGDGVDYLTGGSGSDVIYAGDGGDTVAATTILVGSGDTTVYGGDGIDVINGGGGTDVLYAGDGGVEGCATAVNAGSGAATLYGGAGVSILTDSLGGSDQLIGGDGTTNMFGIGNDTFIAGTGSELLSGTGDNTYIFNANGGDDEVANAGGTETLDFSYDDDPTDDVVVGATSVDDGALALTISDGDTTVLVDGALTGADVAGITFGDSQTESLAGLIQAAEAAGNVQNEVITGTNGNLLFDAGDGDTLTGGSGADTISGWGDDQVISAGSNGTAMYAEGSSDQVIGSATGDDTLAAYGTNSTLTGGLGNETFEVNDVSEVVQAQSGAESNTLVTSVSYTLPTNVDVATLSGSGDLLVVGNHDATNLITGNSGNDTLVAGTGSDTLVSGSGVDSLVGSSRSGDTFVVNNVNDQINTNEAGYADTVQSSVSFTLTDALGIYTLELVGTSNVAAEDDTGYGQITGNAGDDTLTGGSVRDTLTAGVGVDTLVSGTGDNTLVINNTGDVIELSAGAAGKDTLESSVSDTLIAGLDTLVLTGSAAVVGQGNSDSGNTITGNGGNDTLIAGSGDDVLTATGSGDDVLIAGSGNDTLQGSSSGGSDTFVVNPASNNTTIVISASDAASSTIEFGAGTSASDLTVSVVDNSGQLGLQIADGNDVITLSDADTGSSGELALLGDQNLTFTFDGGGSMSLAGLLSAAQVEPTTIAGSTGNFIINGTDGASLTGGTGNDTIIGLGAGDSIVAGIGAQAIYGDGNGDVLVGGTGLDTLYGGSNDTFAAGSGTSVIYSGSGSNTFALTEGGNTTIYLSPLSSGVQTLILPTGLTMSDFTPEIQPDGDLVMQSTAGGVTTSVTIKNYGSTNSQSAWLLSAPGSDGVVSSEFLQDWLASSQQGSGGTSGGSSYEQQVTALLEDYQVSLQARLQQMGVEGESLRDIYPPDTNPTPNNDDPNFQYYFTGVTEDDVTVQGGVLNLGATESVQSTDTQTQIGTTTWTYSQPVYAQVTIPGSYGQISLNDPVVGELESAGESLIPVSENGQLVGYEYFQAPEVLTEQVGTIQTTQTVPVYSNFYTLTRGFTEYNITGDGGSDVIKAAGASDPFNAAGMFAGTVTTGNGNDVSVDLGLWYAPGYGYYGNYYFYPDVLSPGAFIDVGNGLDDTINGTGNADVIAAGLGTDTIYAALGTTVYVPLEGTSTDYIDIIDPPYYGEGPFPHSTLVLPDGITPDELQFKLYDIGVIQITYGDSTVLVPFGGPVSQYISGGATPDDTAGINYFQFSDGTTLTRSQVIAMAGAAITSCEDGPTVTALTASVSASTPISAADLFTAAADANGAIRYYEVSNDAGSGAFFTLNGTTYASGQIFDVAADQLSQLQYVPGVAGSTDTLSVSAFDGLNQGNVTTIALSVATPSTSVFTAEGTDESVVGASTGPDTLTGGFSGDLLEGNSGQDTFTYATAGGAETISEAAPASSSSANVLQFGTGITAGALVGSINTNGSLTLSIGSSGDSITIEGFNPLAPSSSLPIQQFDFTGGSSLTFAQLVSQVQSSGTEQDVTNADGTTTAYSFNPEWGPGGPVYYAKLLNAQGQLMQDYYLNADGSTETDQYSYNPDGSYTDTQVQTTAAGVATTNVMDVDAQGNQTSSLTTYPSGSTDYVTYDSQGRHATEIVTDASGATTDSTYSYNSDGSYTVTNVETPAGGGGTTTVVWDIDSQGNLVGSLQTNPDGSTLYDSWNDQGQRLSEIGMAADGSSDNTTYVYNADGSYTTTDVETPAGGAPATTEVVSYDSSGNKLNDNSYTPGTDGSYSDYWQKPDGSYGSYWWDSSTTQYGESWSNADGTSWTDDYQYASGGSPGSTGVSFTETYSDSAGDQGMRQYDAATGVTTVTWYSSTAGTITGTVTDSGFIGLQNEGELTNTQPDLTFFNPATSPAFQGFLAGH